MKIVLHKTYGGFSTGLSDGALRHIAALKGIQLFEKDCEHWIEFYLDPAHSIPFTPHDLDRTDPDLIRVVEEFGALANAHNARLEVVDIPQGQQYRICEYDGKEWLEFPSDIKWETAA